ncbi:unnamed protein product, partial [Heterosigma akashiwo]
WTGTRCAARVPAAALPVPLQHGPAAGAPASVLASPWVATEIANTPIFVRGPYRILICSLDE